jgi:hypothetical protein
VRPEKKLVCFVAFVFMQWFIYAVHYRMGD